MIMLGDYPTGATIQFKWSTTGADGASITRATNGSIRIYKGSSTTERSSSAGITDTEDFDTLTGVHHLTIDLSDNTDASFYAAGNEYQVVLQGAVIDGLTVNACIAMFSIERSGGILAIVKTLDTKLNTIDDFLDTEIATIVTSTSAIQAKTDNLPAAPAATGDIPTANANADALLDRTAGIETSWTVREGLRVILGVLAGPTTGMDGATPVMRNPANTKTRVTGTTDASGNRSSLTYDKT